MPSHLSPVANLLLIAWKLWTQWTRWTKTPLEIRHNGHYRLNTTLWTCMFTAVRLKVRIFPGPQYYYFPIDISESSRYLHLNRISGAAVVQSE